jgi:hypothetical protein
VTSVFRPLILGYISETVATFLVGVRVGSGAPYEEVVPGAQKNTGGWPVKSWRVTEKIVYAIEQ